MNRNLPGGGVAHPNANRGSAAPAGQAPAADTTIVVDGNGGTRAEPHGDAPQQRAAPTIPASRIMELCGRSDELDRDFETSLIRDSEAGTLTEAGMQERIANQLISARQRPSVDARAAAHGTDDASYRQALADAVTLRAHPSDALDDDASRPAAQRIAAARDFRGMTLMENADDAALPAARSAADRDQHPHRDRRVRDRLPVFSSARYGRPATGGGMANTDRLGSIDALRGFAIIGVFVAHASSLAGIGGIGAKLAVAGGTGVLLFFVISAFTIFMTLERAVGRDRHPIANFFVKRCSRLFPVYWMGIILYTAVYGLESRGWREGPELWHYPLHATLTNLLSPSAMSSVVPGGWSISCEATFYLTVPVIFALVKGWRSAALLVGAAMVLGFAFSKIGPVLFSLDGVDAETTRQYWYRSFPSQLPVFCFGILAYQLATRGTAVFDLLKVPQWNYLALVGSGIIWCASALRVVPGPEHYSFAAAYMMAALAFLARPFPIFVNRVTVFIGRVSFSAYIAHFLVLKQLFDRLSTGQAGLDNVVLIAGGLPLTLALAYGGYRLIELPTTKWAHGWVRQHETSASITA